MRLPWAAFLLLPLAGCAGLGPGPRRGALDSEVDRLFAPYAVEGGPGAAVLVLRDGQPLVRRVFGLADLEKQTPVSPSTNFRLASVSKQFTAMAVLLLAEEGRLGLDDPLSRWIDGLPPWAGRVLIRHLLTHTSGVVDYEDHLPAGLESPLLDAGVRDILATRPETLFPPGEGWSYSNSGYALLALVVERASGTPFPAFLESRIFAPLQMDGTVAHVEGVDEVRDRAFGHSREGEGWRRTDQSLTSAVLGDGGIYSSIDDLARWAAELDAPQVLPARAVASATAHPVATPDPSIRYAYGWRLLDRDGRSLVTHTGETIGFRNALVRLPEERITVVVLTNRNEGAPLELALALLEAVSPGPVS